MRVLKPIPAVTPHLLQQGHTYTNKATPLNSATSRAKHIQTITVCWLAGWLVGWLV
ncbi:mCG1027123 [Mus musculus]|nr:mCG1027123 [Mus musculus]